MSKEMPPGEGQQDVVRNDRASYGDAFNSHLLEQYKLYVEMADRVSARRTSANNYLLTVNAFLVTLYGLATSAHSPVEQSGWLYAVPVAGILVCVTWHGLIKSYKDLNTAKFKVVHELERHLAAALFDREWDVVGRGKGKAYRPLTHVELIIPWIFAGLYALLAFFALPLTS